MKNINFNINKKEEIESNKSDLSITTNLKVFNGYIGNDNLVNELNKKVLPVKNIPISQNSNNQKNLKKVSFLSNLSNEENQRKDSDAFSFGNGNDLGHSSNHSNSNVNSINNSNDLIPNIKSDINNTLNMINNNNINSNRSKNSSLSKKSSGRSMSFNDPNDIEFNNNININNNNNDNNNMISIVPKGLFMTTEGFLAEEMNKNNDEEKNENNNNISINNNNKNLIGDVFYKGFNNIVDCFTVATIEKGVALLVSKEDCIFTLPTSLLPKGIKAGNMYKFAIDQNENNDEIEKEIIKIQKKYKNINFKKNNNEKNDNNNNNNNSINNIIINNIRNNNNNKYNNNNNENKKQKK